MGLFFFLRWQNMVFIFKVETWNFVCDIKRSFAFTMENILSADIPPRLGEHPNLVRLEKRAVKTLQHGQIYGDVFLFHEMKNTYEWWSAIIDTNYIFVANYYAFPVYIFFGQIRYLNIRHERTLTLSPLMLKCSERCRETQGREPAHTGWCLVIQPPKISTIFRDRVITELIYLISAGLYDDPPSHLDTFLLSLSGYSFVSRVFIST